MTIHSVAPTSKLPHTFSANLPPSTLPPHPKHLHNYDPHRPNRLPRDRQIHRLQPPPLPTLLPPHHRRRPPRPPRRPPGHLRLHANPAKIQLHNTRPPTTHRPQRTPRGGQECPAGNRPSRAGTAGLWGQCGETTGSGGAERDRAPARAAGDGAGDFLLFRAGMVGCGVGYTVALRVGARRVRVRRRHGGGIRARGADAAVAGAGSRAQFAGGGG